MAACFRYIANDVDAALEFYTRHLDFKVEMHPAPGFAEISRGNMHLYLTRPSPGPGGGARLPSGEEQNPAVGTASIASSSGSTKRSLCSYRQVVVFAMR